MLGNLPISSSSLHLHPCDESVEAQHPSFPPCLHHCPLLLAEHHHCCQGLDAENTEASKPGEPKPQLLRMLNQQNISALQLLLSILLWVN